MLLCAYPRIKPENIANIITTVQKGIDWDYLLQIAQFHGVLPLLYCDLNKSCPDLIPGTVLDELKNRFNRITQRNLFMTGELIKILKVLDKNGIPAIPYKGPVLAEILYGSLSMRQFGDLDIVVHERDVLKTKDILIASGFESIFQFTAAQEKYILKTNGHL